MKDSENGDAGQTLPPATLLVCNGQCHNDGRCAGDVRRVEVLDHKGSWGKFNYCQTAIECDERNGYRIEYAD